MEAGRCHDPDPRLAAGPRDTRGARGVTRVLLCGFEPFDGERVNPSQVVVHALDGESVGGAAVVEGCVLPVERHRAVELLLQRLAPPLPAVVLMLGEAGGRARVTPERIAINVDDYRIPDNAGHQPRGEPVVAGGPAGYFSTLPVTAMTAAMDEAGVPAEISNSAGTYLCNRVFYCLMHHLEVNALHARAGFMHLPYLHEQVRGKSGAVASLSRDTLVQAVRIALQSAVRDGHPR